MTGNASRQLDAVRAGAPTAAVHCAQPSVAPAACTARLRAQYAGLNGRGTRSARAAVWAVSVVSAVLGLFGAVALALWYVRMQGSGGRRRTVLDPCLAARKVAECAPVASLCLFRAVHMLLELM